MHHVYTAVGEFMDPGHRTLGMALLVAAGTCVFSFLCAAILGLLDKNAEKKGVVGQVAGEESPKISLKGIWCDKNENNLRFDFNFFDSK